MDSTEAHRTRLPLGVTLHRRANNSPVFYMHPPVLRMNLKKLREGGQSGAHFGERAEVYKRMQMPMPHHTGVDIFLPRGTPLYAIESGRVVRASFHTQTTPTGVTFGGLSIEYASQNHSWLYGHCDTVLVNKGDHVTEGQQIATLGDSGCRGLFHVHISLKINGVLTDPYPILKTLQAPFFTRRQQKDTPTSDVIYLGERNPHAKLIVVR
jgi:murein DD-endopeptidase MepM/ murein hydrolase activator NlpD